MPPLLNGHHGDGFDLEQRALVRQLCDLNGGRGRWRCGVDILIAHLEIDRQMCDVDEVTGDLDYVLECGASGGERNLDVLEGLYRLGAKITRCAGELTVHG